ncbi:hypothetical protein F0562_019504 [Nyssa sinensis]|uniref:Uncharacterized protein n=1 Tax=Nyssa sinensis TaxID=561372 RepID=A0A5J5BSS1_9ASTE|nr:hypothetical protein F0562_019504 [Nyssa sinensis]
MSSESPARNEEEGNTGGKVHPVDVSAFGTDASSRDASHFDQPLPQIKDDRDLAAYIAKFQDAFLEDMIVNLGGESHLVSSVAAKLTPSVYRILMGFQALIRFYKLQLGFNEFWAFHIVKQMGNGCYYISPHNVILIQRFPLSEKGWDKYTLEIGAAWNFPPSEFAYVVPTTCGGVHEKADTEPFPHEYSKAELSLSFAIKDQDWSSLLDPTKQVVEGTTIDVLESGLFGISIRIPSESRKYSPEYSLDKEGSLRVPLKRKIFGMDGQIREVMVMVHP